MRLMSERAKSHGLDLLTELPAEPLPGLHADPRLVKQILINLLSNAIKFTPSCGRVTVSLRASPDEGHLLQVADTCIGMAQQDIPKALTRFQQIDGYLTRRFQGAGHGLPLTMSLVELHGGHLEIESALGKARRLRSASPPSAWSHGAARHRSPWKGPRSGLRVWNGNIDTFGGSEFPPGLGAGGAVGWAPHEPSATRPRRKLAPSRWDRAQSARCRVARRLICPACPSSSLLTAGRFHRDQTHR